MMTKDEFKKLGYEVVDWIAEYQSGGIESPVLPQIKPGDIANLLPKAPPAQGETGHQLIEDFKSCVLPGITHWNDPRFFGYFPCNNSFPSILGEFLSAGLGVNTFSWITSPAGTELEIRVMDWLGQMIGLNWPGVIQDTASTATLCALLSARETKQSINQHGYLQGANLVCYVSDQTHSSILKAARIAGIGDAQVRVIESSPVDFSMNCQALEAQIEIDLQNNLIPFFVTASVGTTASTAIDNVPEIARICKKTGCWLHVDAALAGTAAILPEMRWLMNGVELADSFVFNPHKWMFTNFDCSAYFCKDSNALKKALALNPEYLKTANDTEVENLRDWGIQLGRRFRALKLWFVIKSFGVEGLQEKIRLHLAMTQEFATRVAKHPSFTLVGEPKINTVCFRLNTDAETEAFMKKINSTGDIFLTHASLNGKYVIRVAFGQTRSGWEDLEHLWKVLTFHS